MVTHNAVNNGEGKAAGKRTQGNQTTTTEQRVTPVTTICSIRRNFILQRKKIYSTLQGTN